MANVNVCLARDYDTRFVLRAARTKVESADCPLAERNAWFAACVRVDSPLMPMEMYLYAMIRGKCKVVMP